MATATTDVDECIPLARQTAIKAKLDEHFENILTKWLAENNRSKEMTKEANYALIHIKNFYNVEMKSRLESNIFKSQDLRLMHEKLKSDCLLAFTESLNVHEDSGFSDKEKLLHEELDDCFVFFSKSNDSKLEKSTRIISATIRKLNFQFVETIEEKIKQDTYSPKDFKSLVDETVFEVSKLLEIEIRKIPFEDVDVRKEALRKSVEMEIPDLQIENQKKWEIQDEARKKQEEERKLREEENKRRNKEEEERKKQLREQKKDKEEAERKEAERRIQDEQRKETNIHKEILKKPVETQIPDLQTENQRKWNMEEEARKKQEEVYRKLVEEVRKNKEEAERKKKERECKQRRDKEEAERKEAERRMQNLKEAERKTASDEQNRIRMNISSNSNATRTKYDTCSAQYGKFSTYATPTVGLANPRGHSYRNTDQTDNFTVAIEFGPTKIIVGVITARDEFQIIPNEQGENETLNIFGFNSEFKVIYGKSAKSSEGSGFYSADTIFSTNSKARKPTQIKLKGNEKFILTSEFECGIMLSQMKRNAEAYLNRPVHNVVVTVPLWFNSKKRQQMKDSAWIAGFSNVYLINETSAVALALSREETRKYIANDLLVVVKKNERCDAAVYSYTGSEIKMISNFGNEQIPDDGILMRRNKRVMSLIVSTDSEQFTITKGAVKVAKEKSRHVNINEVALVADADEESITAEMRSHGRLLHLRYSSCIINGAAVLARTMTMGEKNPIKDLCTLGFNCWERRKETLIFQPHSPYPNLQKFSFGERNHLKASVLHGSEKIGELCVKTICGYEAPFILDFVLNNDGILSQVVSQNNSQLDVNWVMDNLKPEEIENLRKIVQSSLH